MPKENQNDSVSPEIKELHNDFMSTVKTLTDKVDALEAKGKTAAEGDALDKVEMAKINEAISKKEAEIKTSLKEDYDAKLEAKFAELDKLASRPRITDSKGDRQLSQAEVEYKTAFLKYAATGEGETALKEAEKKMFEGHPNEKALSVQVDSEGGYLVTPEQGGIIQNRLYETSAIRQRAEVVTTSSDSIEYVMDNGEFETAFVSEKGARSETTTPEFDKKVIPVHELYSKPKVTQKMLDDAAINLESWLGNRLAEAIGRKENDKFFNGTGAGEPTGLLTNVTASTSFSGSDVQYIDSGVNGSFTADKLIELRYELKSGYTANATWMMNRDAIEIARTLKDSNGQYLWQPSLQAGQPATLLGYALDEAPDMPTPATNALAIAFGDFRRGYQIVDRIGIRTLRDPYSSKPYIEFYTTKRVGGDVVVAEAIKLMRLTA